MFTLTTLIAMAALAPSTAAEPLKCPVMGSGAANMEGGYRDYNGARYWFCCAGCDAKFDKEPAKYLELRAKEKGASGDFMFDPVTGRRLKSPAIIAETSDYKGVRFHFSSKANKEMFDKEPAKFGAMPKQEALYCAVASEEIESYSAAASYVDFKGVRYYTCCMGCVAKLKDDPAKYVGNAKGHIKTPGIATETDHG